MSTTIFSTLIFLLIFAFYLVINVGLYRYFFEKRSSKTKKFLKILGGLPLLALLAHLLNDKTLPG
ncbi:MAG: hypothetical protein A2729_02150 [Candidatus Buchananbacteria bacterium RIFCSPHIGHO2_01_FULL_39_14]|uniref:Uncharacterized protein n=1 Tax=Candidatus Buchananbacteria bacterium RIFCSPHIGHO2_01_FULL_39_14 TaxID=1797532 RepID=A0A1G1XWF4_9BACT|nr:MAG: hypothetical protein A2729_02150 [Candidatus Buchananbacteria bacterium RIFCSPHIGHO2_01_FULL_39_14]OGY48211.1 MAG: hypothetical protein A3D39_03755 [Candidatus Buchananbacteria bacterium RIFCSPHIGHO2_02_FULL_39_17]